MNAMPALLKFLVLLAIFLSASYEQAFTSLSPVAGNQARVNHLIRFEEPMSNPTNVPSVSTKMSQAVLPYWQRVPSVSTTTSQAALPC